MLAFGLIAIVTLGIAAAFAALGAWLILPFAGIEIVGLGIAFALNGRHAADYERIQLGEGRLMVEVCESDSIRRHEFDPARASVMVAGEGAACASFWKRRAAAWKSGATCTSRRAGPWRAS